VAHGLGSDRLVPSRRETPAILFDFLNRHAVAVRPLLASRPFCQHVGNVVRHGWCALVVEAEAVSRHIVEPHALRLPPLLEDERGGRHPRIRSEHTARQTDHGLQVALRKEQLPQRGRRVRRTEQDAVGDDDARPSPRRQVVDEPLEEQEFGGAGVQFVVEIGEDALVLHLAGKRRIGEDHVEALARIGAAEPSRQRVEVFDPRPFQLVQVEVQDGDLHHVGVVVEAGEGVLFEELPLPGLEQAPVRDAPREVGRFGVRAQDVPIRRNEEAGGAAGGVADPQSRLRVHQGHDQVDDVARRAELAVGARLRQLAQEVLVHVPLDVVAVVRGELHAGDELHHRPQRRPVVNSVRHSNCH